MNERIKEFSLKAAYFVDLEDPKFLQKYSEKFAEMIVRECYNVAEEHDCNLSGNGGEILKHFGV